MTHSPFKLLQPYVEGDRHRYFGRNEETRLLAESLLQTKFLLLYGGSGTGKTSLIQCGLPGMLSPRDWMPVLVRRSNAGFPSAMRDALQQRYAEYHALLHPDQPLPTLQHLSLREQAKALFNLAYLPVYLILDQFEEIFTVGIEDEQAAFFNELQQLNLFRDDLYCKVLIVVREEYIAHFYRYEKRLPFLFTHRFRVEKMRKEQSEEVVSKTLDEAGIETEEGIPAQIVENLSDVHNEVDLPTLQVYLDKLYREHRKQVATTEHLPVCFGFALVGGNKLDGVLSEFLDRQVALVADHLKDQFEANELHQGGNLPLEVLFVFVTDQGTKKSLSVETCQKELNEPVSLPLVSACCAELAKPGCRLLVELPLAKTGVVCYEIVHDRLADQIFKRSETEKPGYREAISVLNSKMRRHEEAKKSRRKSEYLSPGELAFIGRSVRVERLKDKQLADYYQESVLYRKKEERRRYLLTVGAVMAAVVFAVLATVAAVLWKRAEIAALFNGGLVESQTDPTRGLDMIDQAWLRDPGDGEKQKAYYDVRFKNLVYEEFFRSKKETIKAVAFSSNGKIFATAIQDGIIQIYHRGDNTPFRTDTVVSEISCLLFKGNDTLVAGSISGKILLYAPLTGRPTTLEHSAEIPVDRISLSANGQWLLAAHQRNVVTLWNLTNLNIHRSVEEGTRITAVAVSPDGTLLLTGTDKGGVSLHREGTKTPIHESRSSGAATATAFSPNGNTALVAFSSGSVLIVRNIQPNESEKTLAGSGQALSGAAFVLDSVPAHSTEVRSIDFSPDGRFFVTASADGTCKVFNTETKELAYTLLGHRSPVRQFAWTHDGEHLLSADDAGSLRKWAFPYPYPDLDFFVGPTLQENVVVCSPDGQHLLLQTHDTVFVFAGHPLRRTGHYVPPRKDHLSIVSTAMSNRLAANVDDTGYMVVWDFVANKMINKGRFDAFTPAALSFSRDGNRLLLWSRENASALLWRPGDPLKAALLIGEERASKDRPGEDTPDRRVSVGCIAPAGETVVLARRDSTFSVYSATGKLLETCSLGYAPNTLFFTNDGNRIFMVEEGTAGFGYDSKNICRKPALHLSVRGAAYFAADGSFYAEINPDDPDQTDTYTLQRNPLQKLVYDRAEKGPITSMTLHPTGIYLAATTSTGHLLVWKIRRKPVDQ